MVIGNPPYVVVPKDKDSKFKWQGDLYTMFYELSLKNLLKEKGVFSFITPRFFLFNKENLAMRKYLLENVNILSMVECKPFENVTTENEISIIKKEKSTSKLFSFYSYFNFKFNFLNTYNKDWALSNKYLEINPYLTEKVFAILKKIETETILLNEICKNKRGAEIGKNDLRNTSFGIPILIGSDVQKYSFEFTDAQIDINHKEYKRLKEYFENKNMILLRRVSKDLVATISENPIAFSKNLYGIKIKFYDVKFILGLINSKLLNFYYKRKFSTKKEDVFS